MNKIQQYSSLFGGIFSRILDFPSAEFQSDKLDEAIKLLDDLLLNKKINGLSKHNATISWINSPVLDDLISHQYWNLGLYCLLKGYLDLSQLLDSKSGSIFISGNEIQVTDAYSKCRFLILMQGSQWNKLDEKDMPKDVSEYWHKCDEKTFEWIISKHPIIVDALIDIAWHSGDMLDLFIEYSNKFTDITPDIYCKCLINAVTNNNLNITKYICSLPIPNITEEFKIDECEKISVQMMEYLLYTPLGYIPNYDFYTFRPEVLDFIKSKGIKLLVKRVEDYTDIKLETVEWFLKNRCKKNLKNILEYALANDRLDICNLLVSYSCYISIHYMREYSAKILRWLVRNKPDTRKEVFMIAAERGDIRLAKLILKFEPLNKVLGVYTPYLPRCPIFQDQKFAMFLLTHGYSEFFNRNLLLDYCDAGQMKVVKYILERRDISDVYYCMEFTKNKDTVTKLAAIFHT